MNTQYRVFTHKYMKLIHWFRHDWLEDHILPKVKLFSRVWLLATPWTVAHQAPPSMGFSRQEYWSGSPLPSLMDVESWTIKKAECQRTDTFELWCWRRLLRVPWTARRSNKFILKKISPGCSLEGLMLKLKLWPHDVKNWLVGKDPDARKNWRQEEAGTIEDEMVGWHHWLNGHEFEQALGAGDGQGGLACCSTWGYKKLDTTEWLNWTDS